MKGKIKGHVPSSNVNVISQRESMGKYLNIFGQYFDSVGNCLDPINISERSSIALCYSRTNKLEPCSRCPSGTCLSIPDKWDLGSEDPVWEHIHMNQEKPDFLRVEVGDYVRRLCDHSMVISIKNEKYDRVIGEFCPSKKILSASDWSHDDTKVSFISDILSYLKDANLLSIKIITKKKPVITLGADPEFEYIDSDTDKILHCREIGIQDRVPMREGSSTGRIGIDGSGQQRELRPEPASTPEELITNFEKLIQAGLDEKWSLKSEKYPCGGHIHLGGVEESREFGKLLDHYLYPLDALNSAARKRSGYGAWGSNDSVRKQDWGMEYRSPPVGWLASKELAMITLKIVKLAAEKHFGGDDVELTDNIGKDLENLGITEDEVKTYFDEIDKYTREGLPRDFKVAWGYKNPPRFVIEFRDSWNASVKKYITEIIKKMAVEEELDGRCVFYGLSSERGNVFSVVMAHMNGIDMPETYGFMPPLKIGAGKNHVGMPASIRTDIKEVKKMENTILEIVKRTINPPKPKRKIAKKTVVRAVPVPNEPIIATIMEENEIPISQAYSVRYTSGTF